MTFILSCGFCAGKEHSFSDSKTFYQTTKYDPRIVVRTDAVVMHRDLTEDPEGRAYWSRFYPLIGRMFFSDSDGYNEYWTGKWDGIEYVCDVEHDQALKPLLCAGVRPYINPSAKWTEYLKEMLDSSVEAGASAILPEEPLAHVYAGYEGGFKNAWQKRYDIPWQGQHTSALARFRTGQLKAELYWQLEKDLLLHTQQHEKKQNRKIDFVLPIHSIFGNIAGQLTAPLGSSLEMGDFEGYIGQVWTGPINWAKNNYQGDDCTFFSSAYALYNYFTEITKETDKKLWLLVDPVEDDPEHTWAEFKQWYEYSVIAMLLMEDVSSYEVMPWPERIFMPGFATGGGTPSPEFFRQQVLSVCQTLQEIPKGGRLLLEKGEIENQAQVGVVISDTVMWQVDYAKTQNACYGQLMPLINSGIEARSFVFEKHANSKYIDDFDVLVLSYESQIPLAEAYHKSLKNWVADGGFLVILGDKANNLDKFEEFWWNGNGFGTSMEHLLSLLGHKGQKNWKFKKGKVILENYSPTQLAGSEKLRKDYLQTLRLAAKTVGKNLETPGYFYMERGDYVIAQSQTRPLTIKNRKLLELFEMKLLPGDSLTLKPGQGGLYKDITADCVGDKPKVLHATHRLMNSSVSKESIDFEIAGPAQTNAVAILYTAGRKILETQAQNDKKENIETNVEIIEKNIIKLTFANAPDSIFVSVKNNK